MWSCEVKHNELMIQTLKEQLFKLETIIHGNEEKVSHLEIEFIHKNEAIDNLKDKLKDPLHITLGLDSDMGGWTSSYVPKRMNKKYIEMIKPGILNILPMRCRRRLHESIT